MKSTSWLISRYLVSNIWPYFLASWLVLSVILFVQQASRYSDIFFGMNVPSELVWQLALALVPNVVAFTCPMAILVGTMIGLTKMQGDSELVAIRAAGVGNLQLTVPVIFVGVLLSLFAFFINIKGVPMAASLVRQVAIQSAIKKFESPIEPGVFDSAVAGYTIYVRGGDVETGRWKNIFIYSEDRPSNTMRLVTSSDGRVDTSGQASELVLENATVSTLPLTPGAGKYASESIGEVRLAVKTKRSELIDKMSHSDVVADELGLNDLSAFAAGKEGKEQREAYILLQRRILLSLTPLIFCMLGTAIVLRFGRGGRGFGIAAALMVLIGFYLLAFLGEQLARVGAISVYLTWLLPVAGSIALLLWLYFSRRLSIRLGVADAVRSAAGRLIASSDRLQMRNVFVDLTTGLRDFDIIRNLVKNFALALSFLISIFVIFTAFDLWKFAGTFAGGPRLLAEYLLYLLPFVYVQVAPSAAMIAVLSTYVVKSRQNEIVTWTSSGQSVYRLLMPCFLMAMLLGLINWGLQETLLPRANSLQDETRSTIRNLGKQDSRPGKYWVVSGNRIISYEMAEPLSAGQVPAPTNVVASDNEMRDMPGVLEGNAGERVGNAMLPSTSPLLMTDLSIQQERRSTRATHRQAREPFVATAMPAFIFVASDNEKAGKASFDMKNVCVFDFDNRVERLQTVYRSDRAYWRDGGIHFISAVEKDDLSGGMVRTGSVADLVLPESVDPADQLHVQPTHLDSRSLRRVRSLASSPNERENLSIALEKRYSTLFLPFVVALFTAPFSLSLSRKGKAATVGLAVGLWLLFTGLSSVSEQLGSNGMLAPGVAVWSPLVIFSLVGAYLLSRVRT